MKWTETNLARIVDLLEGVYGLQTPAGPSDPYQMMVFLNCGYPASDASCLKGYDALRREVGLKPEELLAAPKSKLSRLLRAGGIVPQVRAGRLRDIARMVRKEFGGDLTAVLMRCLGYRCGFLLASPERTTRRLIVRHGRF